MSEAQPSGAAPGQGPDTAKLRRTVEDALAAQRSPAADQQAASDAATGAAVRAVVDVAKTVSPKLAGVLGLVLGTAGGGAAATAIGGPAAKDLEALVVSVKAVRDEVAALSTKVEARALAEARGDEWRRAVDEWRRTTDERLRDLERRARKE